MLVQTLKDLVQAIEAKDSYGSHTVLDGGLGIVLIRPRTNKWFLHDSQGQWKELTDGEAHDICEASWKEYRYLEMKDMKCQ